MSNLKDFFISYWQKIVEFFPNLLNAIVIITVGYFLARLVSWVIGKVFTAIKFDDLTAKIQLNEMVEKIGVKSPAQAFAKFIYIFILLIFLVPTFEVVELNVVSELITGLIDKIPAFIAALAIFFIGVFIARFIRDILLAAMNSLGPSASKTISSLIYYYIVIMITINALKQAQVDISLLENNFNNIIIAILAAGALAYGFAARDILRNLLASFFSKKHFEVGQKIEVEDIKGTIIAIDSTTIRIDSGNEEIVMPAEKLTTNKVRILKK